MYNKKDMLKMRNRKENALKVQQGEGVFFVKRFFVW